MERSLLVLGAIFGFLAVAAGAFGAHIVSGRLSPGAIEIYELAVRYHMYHALALLGTGLLLQRVPATALAVSGWLFALGILVFSGSLYLLSLTGMSGWASLTPIGGTTLLAGWAMLAWGVWSSIGSQS